MRFEGLVDASSTEDFDYKLEALKRHWNVRESLMLSLSTV